MPPKRRIRAGQDRVARQAARRPLGSLKDRRVGPDARKRYHAAVVLFYHWLFVCLLPTASCYEELDTQLQFYLEHLWFEGDTKLLAGDTLSGVQYFLNTRRIIPGAWNLFRVWAKTEAPLQVPPMLPIILGAMLGLSFRDKEFGFCAVVAAAFHCLLRTGEMLGLSG